MKIIDKYIIRKFLGTFFFSTMLFIFIVIIFDISEKIEDFVDSEATLSEIIFDYYLNFIPYIVNLLSPLFTFIAVIFFTSKMAGRTEVVAILSNGISYRRFLFPYIISAAAIALLSLYLNNFVIPKATKKRIAFEDAYIKNVFQNNNKHIHVQIEPGTYIYLEGYNTFDDIGYRFSIEKFKDGSIYYKLVSDDIRWDSIQQRWTINNYYIRYINGMDEKITKGVKLDTILSFTPNEFGRKDNTIETKNYYELNEFIASEKLKGASNIENYEIEKHRRIAFPFATFVLTLIGVSLASRKVRGGIGMHIGLGLGIAFTYILFMQISTTFASGGLISPMVAVWIPNILFSFLALYLLKIAQK